MVGLSIALRNNMNSYKRPLVFVGTRSNMEPLLEIAEENGIPVLGILDRFYTEKKFEGIDVIGSDLDLVNPDNKEIFELSKYADLFVTTYFYGATNTEVYAENTYQLRMERIGLVKQAGCNLANLIHPGATVSKTARLGRNILMFPTVRIESHVTVGSFCQFMYYNVIAHHSTIGENCLFLPGTTGTAGSVTIGDNVIAGTDTHILSTKSSHTVIGNNVILAPGLTIAKSIPDNSMVTLHGKIIPNNTFLPELVDPNEDIGIAARYKRTSTQGE